MQLHQLPAPKGARKRKRIVGRGKGSGAGKTSGRGENGQKARPGRGIMRALEGGQMPLIRRLPKIGFRSHRPVIYQPVKLEQLSKLKAGTKVNAEVLKEKGLIKSRFRPFKILAQGEVKHALDIEATAFSKNAAEKIKKAGGSVKTVKQSSVRKKEPAKPKT